MTGPQLEESAGFDRSTIDYIQRAAASGLYEIGDWAPNAASRILTTCCFFSRRLAVALPARRLSRALLDPRRCSARVSPRARSSSPSDHPSRA